MPEPSSEFQTANSEQPANDTQIYTRIDAIVASLGGQANPLTMQFFYDPELIHALPPNVRESDQELAAYIANTGNFRAVIRNERARRDRGDTSGFLGEIAVLPESEIADGRTRHQEKGYRLNVEYLRSIGIDPSHVLFFRITQPSETPKPEPYWTSDYFETIGGLKEEIPPNLRQSAVTLVSDLQTLNGNGELIQDGNDDNGMAVRQIGGTPFDQASVLAKIPYSR